MEEKKIYVQKFRDSWLSDPLLKDWLIAVESINENSSGRVAKCKVCDSFLKNHYNTLKDHRLTLKHQRLSKDVTSTTQPKLPFKPAQNLTIRKEEARLALFVSAHTSIKLMDHMGEVINHTHKADEKIKLHRTKCAYIIKNVLAPYFSDRLRDDMKDQPFSLLIDESTDISVHKYLGIIAIYYSNTHKKIISTYLDLVELSDCDASGITNAIKQTLHKFDLSLSNLMGIGTDNASVMTGINEGVFAKLKKEVPHLILVRCLCHSLQLAVSTAAKKFLPRNLEFIIDETYNWFCRSASRQNSYRELYKSINDGHDPLKIVQSCNTRWLSIESAVSRIFSQWSELKNHFSKAKLKVRCYKAELLHANYCDDINYAYFAFLCPILTEVNRVNKMFEAQDSDHTRLCDELSGLIDILVKKITLPSNKVNIFTQKIQDFIDRTCYLGYKFENCISNLVEKGLPKTEVNGIRSRCIQFIIDLIEELKRRLPENLTIMKKINRISVNNALNHNKQSIVDLLTFFGKSDEFIEKVDEQWRQIHLLKWNETTNTNQFWYEVLQFQDSLQQPRFQELGTFAISLLVLPHSNAEVERLFSTMNDTKTKKRNRMKSDLLTSILSIRAGLKREMKCCNNYDIPLDVIQKIGTKEVYSEFNSGDISSDEEN